jgi:hypothetical protein
MSQYIVFITQIKSYKRLNQTLSKKAAERLYNSIGNRPVPIACLEYHIDVLQSLLQLLSSRWARLSTLMVGTQQMWKSNDMHAIITRIKL